MQFRVDPVGRLEAISTHDQVLGGKNGQIFLGCALSRPPRPTASTSRREACEPREALADKGVLGRFGIDFISVKEGDAGVTWRSRSTCGRVAPRIPFIMLQFLTDGRYDPKRASSCTPSGRPRCYYASDNLESPHYRGLTPDDLIDIAVLNGLHFMPQPARASPST